jgi:hypothetical protein
MSYKGKPKIIILGIDGLEYNLVKEWQLKNIMQKEYCRMELSDYDVIVTPPIWGSMLTGKINKEIMKIWIKQAELTGGGVNVEQKWWAKFGKFLPYSVNFWLQDHIFAKLQGGDAFEKTANYVKEKNEHTIFDFFEWTWTNGIPSYGRQVIDEVSKKLTENAIAGDKKPYKIYAIEKYKKDKEQLQSALKKQQYDFIFWYTGILDSLGHVNMGNPLALMMKHYLEINQVVGEVKESCPNSIIYIVSDHGMERMAPKKSSWGMHSDHGFFSSSTGEKINRPFKLYELISKHKSV